MFLPFFVKFFTHTLSFMREVPFYLSSFDARVLFLSRRRCGHSLACCLMDWRCSLSQREQCREEKEDEGVKKREKPSVRPANDDDERKSSRRRVFFSFSEVELLHKSQKKLFFPNLFFPKKRHFRHVRRPRFPRRRAPGRLQGALRAKGGSGMPRARGRGRVNRTSVFFCSSFWALLLRGRVISSCGWNPPRGRLAALARFPSSCLWTLRSDSSSFARRKGLERRNWRRSELVEGRRFIHFLGLKISHCFSSLL